MPHLHPADQLGDLDASDLANLAADQLHAGDKWDGTAGHYTAAAAYALTSIAVSLHRLADRHAPDLATLRPLRDDR